MSLPKAFVAQRIQDAGLDILRGKVDFRLWEDDVSPDRATLLDVVKDVEGLLSSIPVRVDRELFEAAPRLRVVSNYAVGYDNIDVAEATRRGILVTNTPGVLTAATADLTMTLILMTARRVMEADAFLRSGKWKNWHPNLLVGREVSGATLGIIGMGQIGQAVARRAKGFDMKILYFDAVRRPEIESSLGARFVQTEELLRESDFVSLHCVLNDSTRGMIGEEQLKMMKKTAILINAARGPLVDQAALFRACAQGWIWGAGLDVFEKEPVPLSEPLLQLRNVVTLPHVASATNVSREGMARKSAENMLAALTGRKPENLVNPEAWKS